MGEYVADWTSLTAGQVICIRKKGQLIRVGQVDTVVPQGDVLWLRRDGVEPRGLFHQVEGYTAWIVSDATMQDAPIHHFILT